MLLRNSGIYRQVIRRHILEEWNHHILFFIIYYHYGYVQNYLLPGKFD